VAATYPVPKSAILPLVLLIFGLGEASKVVMVALGVFYPVIINTTAGVLEIERIYLDLIAPARQFIYAESQYFSSRRIAEAIARRLEQTDGPESMLAVLREIGLKPE